MIRVAETKYGTVEGLPAADPRVTSFKGIPFAAPPIGENRWRAPQPLKPWEGVLKAYEFAPISIQDTPGLGTDIYCREWHVDPEISMSEDCLYLNVWTNAKSVEDKLPVLVWIFGGAFQWGYTAEMEFDGERIARRDIVVVTVNYRIGAFGFLTHPELSAAQPEAPANFGLLDQQAGIRWVKENIAAFGGDPENITVAGQSAGGASTLCQITSETNYGAFHKAVIMSGMFQGPFINDPFITPVPLKEAEQKGVNFFEVLGAKSLEEARKIDALKIREKYGEYATDMPLRFAPCIDGIFMKDIPLKRFAKGEFAQIPVMAGNTIDEFTFFADEAVVRAALSEEDATRMLSFDEMKPVLNGEQVGINVIETGVKAAFSSKERFEKSPCYYYQFDADIPGEDNPGTFHSVDLWFFFETLAKCSRPFVGRHYDLARQMCNYWCNFIKNGDPNGVDSDGTPLTKWEAFHAENRVGVRFTKDGVKAETDDSAYKNYMVDYIVEKLL